MPKKFNDNWYFRKEVKETSDSAGGSNYVTATDWQPVTIPHDWLISDSNNLYQTSIGYYRKAWDASDLQYGQRAILCFDGVYMDCELFVNSQLVGCWQYGYTAFHFDITDFVNLLDPSNNTIMLKVNYQSPNSRWYTGAGIYRDCFMLIKNSTHFAINGIYITPKRQLNDIWHVNIATEIVSDTKNYTVRHKVDSITEGIKTLPNGDLEFFAPQMWSLFNPACYYIISEIVVNGEVVDKVTTRFGFREIQFDPNKGFFLNGKNVKINGVCQHHDLGALGAAVHPDALRRQLTILKSMGVNAIRTAHNPPAKLFMELCDQMGFLVMSEFTDMWKRPKNKYDYARFFEEHSAKDVAAWIRRDRNCPSIIMWSVGNEIVDTHASYVDGLLTLQELVDNVRKHDPQSHAQITLCSNYMAWENTQKCVDILKLVGYNYAEYLYDDHHKKFPDWIIYGGETASTVQSRGVYHFPLAASVLSDDDLQCSALGNSTTSWGAKNAETCIKDHRDRDFIFGQFIWTGTDYIGEPTPYHTKNSYFGQIDTAGFPKDSYYIFKAGWTDFRRAPFIHILPHWDWSPGQPIDVRVCSNVKQVELFLNDVSLGVKDIDLVADYVVPYESGTLRATAIARNGTIVAEHSRHSFGDTASLQLTNTTIGELIFTEITAVDENGNIVENANNRVILSLIEGELLGTDNGDSTDRESYQQADRRLFNGKLLAISKPNSVTDGTFEIYADLDDYDIPVRKIELTNVSKSEKEFEISAELFPKTATPQNIRQLQWRLTDANGIDSPLGTLEVAADGLSAKILPKGDGEAYVRCGVTNGNSHLSIISVFPINITGFGKPFLNPYDFVAGGLYNRCNEPMTNGNDRGVATLRDRDSHVGFADLDFGADGSDEITMWLFPLAGEPFPIEIWEGMPEVGELLTTVTYDKGSIWNTYQEVTYKLPKRLQGVTTVAFLLRQKVHIKGFTFAKQNRTYSQISFTDNNNIYGDSFKVTDHAIENIGNNVTITFNGLNFDKNVQAGKVDKQQKIEICSRSQQDKNSIRLVFTPENGKESVNMVTVFAMEYYGSVVYDLETPLVGKGSLSFIFLPGCEIDLMWFKILD